MEKTLTHKSQIKKSISETEFLKQFVFTPFKIDDLKNFNSKKIGNHYLSFHDKLNICDFQNDSFECIIVGDLYDYQYTDFDNEHILENICRTYLHKEIFDFVQLFEKYCGSYLVFFYDKELDNTFVFTDATGTRECYYHTTDNNQLIAASQAVTINSICSLEIDDSEEAKSFFNSKAFQKRMTFVADTTNFKGVKRLKPNYLLDLNKKLSIRYFPYEKLQRSDVDSTAKIAAEMIKGYITSASKRYKMAIPVSGGWESRVLLAASKDISDKTYYFVYKHSNYSDNHPDIKYPKMLLEQLGLTLHIFECSKNISEEHHNNLGKILSFPRFSNFNYLFSAVNQHIPNYLILNGNVSEICRMQWDEIKIKDEYRIAFLENYPYQQFALKHYKKWLEDNNPTFEKYNYRASDMLYWEENSANWVGKANSETRIIADALQPFNSKKLIKTLMSVDKKYRQKQHPILYKKIIETLWAECLSVPINPGFKKKTIRFMQIIGIYGIYRELYINLQLKLAKIKSKRS
ncbi:MAG: hypothetical protein ISP71_01290 [Flavobacteriales bacterium]|nr:hypothetical protein [Flavobacteriales bacterium]